MPAMANMCNSMLFQLNTVSSRSVVTHSPMFHNIVYGIRKHHVEIFNLLDLAEWFFFAKDNSRNLIGYQREVFSVDLRVENEAE